MKTDILCANCGLEPTYPNDTLCHFCIIQEGIDVGVKELVQEMENKLFEGEEVEEETDIFHQTTKWEIAHCEISNCDKLLSKGWEPFGVTEDEEGFIRIFFRRIKINRNPFPLITK